MILSMKGPLAESSDTSYPTIRPGRSGHGNLTSLIHLFLQSLRQLRNVIKGATSGYEMEDSQVVLGVKERTLRT